MEGMSITQASLLLDLQKLGIHHGDTLMVHSSLRNIGATNGRASMLMHALLESVGPAGTIMAYVDFDPEANEGIFDSSLSPARPDYGVFPEVIRTWPGAHRSANPGASCAAVGGGAEWICSEHPMNFGYGEGSPLEKLVQLEGKVLLLGSDPDQVTLLHYAEHLVPLDAKRMVHRSYKVRSSAGEVRQIDVTEYDTSKPVLRQMPDNLFARIITDYLVRDSMTCRFVGAASSYALPAPKLTTFAVDWMLKHFS